MIYLQTYEAKFTSLPHGWIKIYNTKKDSFDMMKLKNTIFVYIPRTNELVLANEKYTFDQIIGMQSARHPAGRVKFKGSYLEMIMGYVSGKSREYKNGLIHFVPILLSSFTDEGVKTIEMFIKNGGNEDILLRGMMCFDEILPRNISGLIMSPEMKSKWEIPYRELKIELASNKFGI